MAVVVAGITIYHLSAKVVVKSVAAFSVPANMSIVSYFFGAHVNCLVSTFLYPNHCGVHLDIPSFGLEFRIKIIKSIGIFRKLYCTSRVHHVRYVQD